MIPTICLRLKSSWRLISGLIACCVLVGFLLETGLVCDIAMMDRMLDTDDACCARYPSGLAARGDDPCGSYEGRTDIGRR